MKQIGELLKEPEREKTRGGINSKRSAAIAELIVFMGEDKTLEIEKTKEKETPGSGRAEKKARIQKRVKYWLGRTRKLDPDQIYEMMRKTKGSKNPPALFNFLLKNHGK